MHAIWLSRRFLIYLENMTFSIASVFYNGKDPIMSMMPASHPLWLACMASSIATTRAIGTIYYLTNMNSLSPCFPCLPLQKLISITRSTTTVSRPASCSSFPPMAIVVAEPDSSRVALSPSCSSPVVNCLAAACRYLKLDVAELWEYPNKLVCVGRWPGGQIGQVGEPSSVPMALRGLDLPSRMVRNTMIRFLIF